VQVGSPVIAKSPVIRPSRMSSSVERRSTSSASSSGTHTNFTRTRFCSDASRTAHIRHASAPFMS
jgi:hypothetical protein